MSSTKLEICSLYILIFLQVKLSSGGGGGFRVSSGVIYKTRNTFLVHTGIFTGKIVKR